MSAPLSVLETLWSDNALRCVFVQHLQSSLLAVQVFDGPHAGYSELVDSRVEALNVAATLWSAFIGRDALTCGL
jgi:hypothetical protein